MDREGRWRGGIEQQWHDRVPLTTTVISAGEESGEKSAEELHDSSIGAANVPRSRRSLAALAPGVARYGI